MKVLEKNKKFLMLYLPVMELWMILALISLLAAGIQAFIQKVGAVRHYSSSLLNGYSAGIAAIFGFLVVLIFEGFSGWSWLLLLVAFVSGTVSLLSGNLRMDSLRYIDTTISLPIHKFVSPLFVLIIGILIFNESLTKAEWVGIILGMFIPLLLINHAENLRQTNLSKGVLLITFSGLLSAVAFAINKEATELFTSTLLFVAITQTFMAVVGAFLYRRGRAKNTHLVVPLSDPKLLRLVFISGFVQFFSFACAMLALAYGGALAIVYTIQSLYIIIPIVLSIILYNENWNAKKVLVIILSILVIALMQ